MVTSLFKYDRIRTTDVKAKELRRWADQLVTLAKRGDLHARRMALSIIRERDVVQKLFAEAQDRYGAVSGGYTRIVKVGRRPGDAAPVSIIELITDVDVKKKDEKKPKKAAKKASKSAKPAAAKPEKTEEKASEADVPTEKAAEAADASTEAEAATEETPAEETPDEAASEEADKKEE
jgi:large subunit ribosomal protein L17